MATQAQPTGLYIQCPHESHHPPPGIAVPIMAGKKSCFWRCACGANGFCPPGSAGQGMNYQQAVTRGLQVPTVFRIRKKENV